MTINTVLKTRTLWYDGDSSVSSQSLLQFVMTHPHIQPFVDVVDDAVVQYNKFADEKLQIKQTVTQPDFSWNIPEYYKQLDVKSWLFAKLKSIDLSHEEHEVRKVRLEQELALFAELNLNDLLQVMLYIVDTLEANKQVWGVGRGSSVASYVLYLMGVHDIDSIEYDLNISEFLRNDER